MRVLDIIGWSSVIGGLAWIGYVLDTAYAFYMLMDALGGRWEPPVRWWEYLGPVLHLVPIAAGILIVCRSRITPHPTKM
jgi:hypothetical protein